MVTIPRARRASDRRKIRPVAALILAAWSADVEEDVPTVTLAFDRAIDVASIRVAAIEVGTIATGGLYQGSGVATLVDPRTVQVPLALVGAYPGSSVELFAGADTGIVATDDGGTWAGTGDVPLP